VTYTGLHCFPDPAAAIAELACVLRPRGELRGTSVIKRTGLRQDAFVLVMQLGGVFGPGQTLAELETSLADAGLVKVSTSRHGALAYFSARRRGGSRAGPPPHPEVGIASAQTDSSLAVDNTMRGARDARRDE
jgi:hypothetical protein